MWTAVANQNILNKPVRLKPGVFPDAEVVTGIAVSGTGCYYKENACLVFVRSNHGYIRPLTRQDIDQVWIEECRKVS